MWLLFALVLCVSLHVCTSYYVDPSDYFSGAQHRPRLEITNPENGQILDNGDLEIRIKVDGYEMPSKLHNSTICVGLSTGLNFAEQCFEQTAELVFHANGLSPGNQYSLRIVLYERSHAIAVSVRNFRVAGIRGLLNSDDIVTIQTAVQVAMEYQMMGLEAQAELIYRSILNENPAYPDALHLLGVIFYQKGDVQTAIPYIERALLSNKSFEGFHNSLGVCYRTLGRNEEAEGQFKLAIALNPEYMSAVFNLGLTYQQMNRWDAAIAHYHQVNEVSKLQPDVVKPQVRLESKIRECDLVQGQGRLLEALRCWEDGIELFPDDGVIRNEIGAMYARAELYDAASGHLTVAIEQGFLLAELNLARVREIQGYADEARAGFERALQATLNADLPYFHILICLTTVHPKVLSSVEEAVALRAALDSNLSKLLQVTHSVVDNTAPTSFGYSTGYLWLFHQTGGDGPSNAALKTMLYRVYRAMCPALLQGYFLDTAVDWIEDGEEAALVAAAAEADQTGALETVAVEREGQVSEELSPAASSATLAASTSPESSGASASPRASSFAESSRGEQSAHSNSSSSSSAGHHHSAPQGSQPPPPLRALPASPSEQDYSEGYLPRTSNRTRVGFASRFLYSHPVGMLVQGLVALFNEQAADEVEVVAFFIGGGEGTAQYDVVQNRIAQGSLAAYNLPVDDIATCARAMRLADVDVLVYPEVGIDLATYFMTFARLAPVQAAWLGHPDTTGVQTVDYFLTSDVEAAGAETSYSELLYRFTGFGTKFIDDFSQGASLQRNSPRTVLLNRAKLTEEFRIPKSAHLYMVSVSVSKLHPSFDDAIRTILAQDRLGYILLVTEQPVQPHWRSLFLARLTSKKHAADLQERVLFHSPSTQADLLNAMLVSHVLLDAFPVNEDYHILLMALSVGLPVVTLPSQVLGGRFALALYTMLNYGLSSSPNAHYSERPEGGASGAADAASGLDSSAALIVSSVHDYTTMALKLAHQPKLRAHHVQNILANRHRLFENNSTLVMEEWRTFLRLSLQNRKITRE